MVFLRSSSEHEARPYLHAGGLVLRAPQLGDYAQWADLRAKSREYLTPWEPRWAGDELSRTAYKLRLRHYEKEMREQVGHALFLFREADRAMVGGITISNIRRGVTQSCSIGYWIGAPFAGRGYMTAGVGAAVRFCFETIGLHRVEAACLPANLPSIRVLEKTGFTREGFARRYLKINGLWQDHLLFARLGDDPWHE
jgi:ribosomal-protein-alanine N-acetyltransferase